MVMAFFGVMFLASIEWKDCLINIEEMLDRYRITGFVERSLNLNILVCQNCVRFFLNFRSAFLSLIIV